MCVFYAVRFVSNNSRVIICACKCFVCTLTIFPTASLFFFLFYHYTNVLLDKNSILQDESDILIPKCG